MTQDKQEPKNRSRFPERRNEMSEPRYERTEDGKWHKIASFPESSGMLRRLPISPEIEQALEFAYQLGLQSHPTPTPDLRLTDEAKEMITRQLPKFEQDVRESERKAIGEWIEKNAVVSVESKEVIPGKLSMSQATYGFYTKEWHELLTSLRAGEPPQGKQ